MARNGQNPAQRYNALTRELGNPSINASMRLYLPNKRNA